MWIAKAAWYVIELLVGGLAGKMVFTYLDKPLNEAPDLFGFQKYRVRFVADTPIGHVEKEASFPFLWLARLFIWLMKRRYVNMQEPKTIYQDTYATVTC